MLILRDYQTEAISSLRAELAAGKRRLILYSPTGSGKTEMGFDVIRRAIEKGKRVLFIANRIQLVGQTSRRLYRAHIDHGVVQGQNTRRSDSRVLVCSIQTLKARGFPDDVDLIVIDEAHAAAGTQAYVDLITHAKVPVIGLTATPFSRGLGKHYDSLEGGLFESIVVAATISDLIEKGHLVDIEIYAPSEPDLNGVKITAGDYNEKQLGFRVNKTELVGDIVKNWTKLANGKQTVCFATNIAHSQNIVESFKLAGIRAEHIDCHTDDEERAAILNRFSDGTTTIVSNVGVLAEGWDCPSVEVMILARPTRSLTRYIQMCGRVLRPAPGKEHALILDHSGSCRRLGFPTDDLPLELDDGRPQKAKAATPPEEDEKLPKPCPVCGYVKKPGIFKCPKCGHEQRRPDKVAVKDGELSKLERCKATPERKQEVYSQFFARAKQKGYSDGWIAHKYKEYFGVWPRGMVDKSIPITPEIESWLKSTQIRWAHRRKDVR